MNLSAELLDHFDHPRNAGAFEPGTPGVLCGEAGAPEQGILVRFELKIAAGRVEAARFKALGCMATIACASMVADWLPGQAVEDAYNMEVRQLVEALRIPAERMYAPLIVEDAMRAALEEGKSR